MTTYRGSYVLGVPVVQWLDGCDLGAEWDGEDFGPYPLPLDAAQRLRPSCTGFGWGYLGAGSHCLALALLFDVTRDERVSLELFEEFALRFVRDWAASWEITSDEIETWIVRARSAEPGTRN